MCSQPINKLGIHILWCTHAYEHTQLHDNVCNVFASIAKLIFTELARNCMFFLLSLQTSKQHVDIILFKAEVYSTLQKSKQHINIVLSNKGVCTLIDVIVVNPAYIPMFSVRNNFYSWFCNFKANPNLDSLLNPTIAWQNKLKAYLPCQHFNCVRKVKREKYMLKQVISKKDLWLDKAMLLSINDPLVLLPAWLTIQKIEAQKVLTHTWSLCFTSTVGLQFHRKLALVCAEK